MALIRTRRRDRHLNRWWLLPKYDLWNGNSSSSGIVDKIEAGYGFIAQYAPLCHLVARSNPSCAGIIIQGTRSVPHIQCPNGSYRWRHRYFYSVFHEYGSFMDVGHLTYFSTGRIYCTYNRYAYCTLRPCILPKEFNRLHRDNWAFSIEKIWIILRTYSRRIRKWETPKTRLVKHHLE